MKTKIAIVIIHYKNIKDTFECLSSLNITSNSISVYIVDNGNEFIDESKLSTFNYYIKYIRSNINLGFAAANNLAISNIELQQYKYIMFLNNDTVLIENFFPNALKVFDEHERIGIIGIPNYYYQKPSDIWQAGANINFKKGKVNLISYINFNNPFTEVDYVPGSSLLIRCDLLNPNKLFDERFFFYWEEVDVCINVKKKGYKVVFLNQSKLLHKVNKSSNKYISNYFYIRNKLYFFKKNKLNHYYFIKILSYEIIKQLLKSIFYILYGDYIMLKSTILAFIDFFRGKLFSGSLNKLLKK